MNKNLVWWPEPATEADIAPYVEQVTSLMGDGIWAKLLRDILSAEWNEIITTGGLAELPDDVMPKRKR